MCEQIYHVTFQYIEFSIATLTLNDLPEGICPITHSSFYSTRIPVFIYCVIVAQNQISKCLNTLFIDITVTITTTPTPKQSKWRVQLSTDHLDASGKLQLPFSPSASLGHYTAPGRIHTVHKTHSECC